MDQQTPQSYIQIIFKEPGSVLFDAQVNGVTPLQFLALGEYFRLLGETQLAKEQMQREEEMKRKKIAVPGNMDWNLDLKD
jgi:hypothetical protein